MRSNGGILLGLSLLFLAGACGCGDDRPTTGADTGEGPATIILITVDGLILDQLSTRGGSLSMPSLASLADDGVVWRDVWTACPMTRPAVATYLSGLSPDRHGVRDDLFTSLPEGTPTLATLLASRGYRSAAFPDSSFLGFSSGLLDGFDLVADPPSVPIRPERWLPKTRPADQVARDFATWLDSAQESERLFGWVHFSVPLLAEMMRRPGTDKPAAKETGKQPRERPAQETPGAPKFAESMGQLDSAVGTLLEAVARRGQAERTLIIVAGTLGASAGSETEPRGAGFSLAEGALQIPLIVRFPSTVTELRSEDEPVWAPDITATIASLAGASLPAGAEGTELTRAAPSDRVLFAWSWATRDQAGWRSLRAARSNGVKRLEGVEERTLSLDGAGVAVDPEVARSLAEELARRAEPVAPRVPLDQARPFLEKQGLTLDPVPPQGRAFGRPEERSLVARGLWLGRRAAALNLLGGARQRFDAARSNDPACLGALLDNGMLRHFSGDGEAIELLGRAAELYPTDPEVLHWYAHALWSSSWQEAEQLLLLVLPHQPRDADLLYDLACTRSLAGDLDASEGYLRDAIVAGYRDWGHMEMDADLRELRSSGRFAAVLRELGP